MRFYASSFLLLLMASLCCTPNCRGASPDVRGRKLPKGWPFWPGINTPPGIPGWPGTPSEIPGGWPYTPSGIPGGWPGTPSGIPGWTGTPSGIPGRWPDTPSGIPGRWPGTPSGIPGWKVPPSGDGCDCRCWCSSSSSNVPPPPPPPPSRTIVVGSKNKWNFGYNYTDWAIKAGPLYVGDVLEFDYLLPSSGRTFNHSVVLLKDEDSFERCDLSGSLKIANEYAGGTPGGFKFLLGMKTPSSDQKYYFACGEKNGFHCKTGGMKFAVLPILRS